MSRDAEGAKIDPSNALVRVQKAHANVLSGRARVSGAKADLRLKTEQLERQRALHAETAVSQDHFDSAETAHILNGIAVERSYDVRLFHVPKTIDNDLCVTDHCPGYGSAARFVASAVMGDNEDNRSLGGVKIDVIMGRHAGWLTAASTLARVHDEDGPHLVYVPEQAFDLERCGNATMSLSIAQAALDQALDYVQERQQFGRPIVEFQAVQLKLANMAMKIEAARLLIYRAVENAFRGFPSIKDSSIAKCFANEMVREVTGDALQMMGGYGYHKDSGMEQRFRDAWGWGIAGGAIDIQKTNIASALIGKRFSQRRESV